MDFNWRQMLKHWAGIPVLILVVLVLLLGVPYLTGKYRIWQVTNTYKKLAEPYYKDTYGGKTPEETYDLFIAALKDGDVDLASKYFVVEKQDDWLKTLEEYKNTGILLSFAFELEDTKKIWQKSDKSTDMTISFTYQVLIEEDDTATFEGQDIKIPAGNYTNETVFSKYPTGIWKIEGF